MSGSTRISSSDSDPEPSGRRFVELLSKIAFVEIDVLAACVTVEVAGVYDGAGLRTNVATDPYFESTVLATFCMSESRLTS